MFVFIISNSNIIMDIAYRFEQLINKVVKRPTYVTYSDNWNNGNERISLLYTACLITYDNNSTGKVGLKLQGFMEELFKDKSKNKGLECLEFLNSLNE